MNLTSERPTGTRPRARRSTAWRITLSVATAVATTAALLTFATSANAADLLTDDFEDGNASGWSASGGSWSVVSGAYRQSSTSSDAKSLTGQTSWTNYSIEARVTPTAFNGSNRSVGIAARVQSTSNFYSLVLNNLGRFELRKVVGGAVTSLSYAPTSVTPGAGRMLRLDVNGSTLRGYLDGLQLITVTDATFATGRVGAVASYASGTFDNVRVYTGVGPDPSPSTSISASPSASVSPSPLPPIPPGQPDGFASVNALGRNGTTGGAGGTTVTVTTAEELRDYVGRAGPYIIRVSGSIALGSMATVVADKTIVGVGSTAQITTGGLQLGSTTRPGNNVIIRNITFRGASDDSISVTNSAHHVWIDHNEFYPAADGSLDVKRQSTFVTISWNRFHGTDKSMLLGHSDGYTADVGYLKVTYHHNLFDGSNQRHPRARFGEPVHVYNNHYKNIGLYGIASTMNAGLVVEGNYFENVAYPCYSTSGYADSDPGRLVQRNNTFVGSGVCEAGGTVAEPGSYYSYNVDPSANVPAIVAAGAGVGRIS